MKASRSATVPRGEARRGGPAENHGAGAGASGEGGGRSAYCIPLAAWVAPIILRGLKPANDQVPSASPLTSCSQVSISLLSNRHLSFLFLFAFSQLSLFGPHPRAHDAQKPMLNNLLEPRIQVTVSTAAATAAAAAATAGWSVHLIPCKPSLLHARVP